MSAYGQSKLAVLMFALELDRRSRAAGWGIMSNAAHPGLTKTNLQISGPSHGREKPAVMERLYKTSVALRAVPVAGDRRRDPARAVRGRDAAGRGRRASTGRAASTRWPAAVWRRPRCPRVPATTPTAGDCGSFPNNSPVSATRAKDCRSVYRSTMPESSIVVRPEPMESATYTASSRLQAAGLLPAVALFEQAAAEVPLPTPPQPIVIADYGAATGHNSLKPMSAAIKALRRRTRHDHAILVAHTDVPDNDFTALFRTLADDQDSYLNHDTASFPSAIGRSFYSQILPSNTVNLGWSSWAVQWLSRIPAGAPEFSDHVQVAYSKNAEARAAYAHQAATDWNDFVAFRGRELAPDGRLVVLTMAVDEYGEFGYRAMNDALYATLNDQVSDGLLHRDELRRMALPVFARDEKDFRAPFSPKGRFEGLTIEHLEIFNADDRFWESFQSDGDAEAFGARWAAFARAALFPTWRLR